MKKTLALMIALMIAIAMPLLASAVDSIEAPSAPPAAIQEIAEEVQTTFRVTVHYVFTDGRTAAPDFTQQLDSSGEVSVQSPNIENYTPTMRIVTFSHPTRDMEVTVIYAPGYFSIEDYETPLGIGATMMNIGVCIE